MNTCGMNLEPEKRETRRSQEGFITLLSLVILAFIMSLANAYFTAGSKETDVSRILLASDRARAAAHAGTRLVAGILIQDAVTAPATDHCAENWALATENTSATVVPYALDSTNGVYFQTIAVDLSGRFKANATNEAMTGDLITEIPTLAAADVTNAVTGGGNGGYWAHTELYFVSNVANSRSGALTTYGRDFKVNLNTVDYREDLLTSGTNSPAWLISFMLKVTLTNTMSNNNSRKILRCRRGGTAASVNNDATYNLPAKDSNQQYVITDVVVPTDWRTMANTFTTPVPNAVTISKIDSIAAAYGRVNSEGFFMIKGIGWVVKNPAAGSGSARRASHNVLRIIKRSATGYQDCANREWFYQRGDLLSPPFTNGDYDYEQGFYLYAANY